MNNNKYYAVKKGLKVGIYSNWEECKEYVTGYKGAQYKSFKTFEEAEAYLKDELLTGARIEYEKYDAIAYTDGSYDVESGYASYGAILIINNNSSEYSGIVHDKYQSRNVTGEIEAVKQLIQIAINKKVKNILICHDYEGISKWVNGSWKTKSPISIEYLDYMQKVESEINIDFKKILAHSGDKYNEIADSLAKNELKSLKPDTKKEYGYQSYRYSDTHIEHVINEMKQNHPSFHAVKKNHSNHFVFTCTFSEKERMTIQKYSFKSGNALNVIVDTKTSLFNLFVTYLTEKDKPDNILYFLNANLNENIQIDLIKNKYKEIFQYHQLDIIVYRLVMQGIFNYFLEVEDFIDSSFLSVPVFRALEAHLKIIIKKELGTTIKRRFDVFCESEIKGIYVFNKIFPNVSKDIQEYILKCYNYYVSHRNPLFHSGNIEIGDIKMLNTADSKAIILDALTMIAQFYLVKRDKLE